MTTATKGLCNQPLEDEYVPAYRKRLIPQNPPVYALKLLYRVLVPGTRRYYCTRSTWRLGDLESYCHTVVQLVLHATEVHVTNVVPVHGRVMHG
jgi:hypothetical protein